MNLTTEQMAAVTTDARDCIVVAGAGSGKTRVLTERIRFLLDKGASAHDLLVLTFTRKAAAEMRTRLERSLSEDGVRDPKRRLSGMLMGTFHSVALHFLRSHGQLLGYQPSSITVVDPADADMLLCDACEDLGFVRNGTWRGGISSWKQIRGVRERYYQTGKLPTDLQRVSTAIRHYQATLFSMNTMDFGTILIRCHELLGIESVLQFWRDRIKHVLLDEAQDCDTIQYKLHEFFAPPATFFAVGDTRQCIYTFRGARPDLMVSRRRTATALHLRACFRSGTAIVECANRLIDHNEEPLAEPMIGANLWTGEVLTVTGRSQDIAELILWFHDCNPPGHAWSEIAVLSRRHSTLKRLAHVLADMGVPHHRVGGGFDVCDTDEFRQLHAVLRLLINERDEVAFRRVLDIYRSSRMHYTALRAKASQMKLSTAQFVLSGLDSLYPSIRALLMAMRDPARQATVGELMPMLRPFLPDHGAVFNEADWFWINHCHELTVPDALAWFATRDAQDDLPTGLQVTLATIHAAKGLEWPVVILLDLNEGSLPSSQSLKSDDGTRDERRVCYVGITRAKTRLILHWRRPRDQSAKRKIADPSRFLGELGRPVTPVNQIPEAVGMCGKPEQRRDP